MTIRIKGLTARNNGGDGIRIEGHVSLEAEDIALEGNAGDGISIRRHAPLMARLGLPKDTDPSALARLLHELQSVRPSKRGEHAVKSSLVRGIGKGVANATQFAANIATIANGPGVMQLIRQLLT